jgi:hypothetical protein
MKKWFIGLFVLISLAFAGDLKSGVSFAREVVKIYNIKEVDCYGLFRQDQNTGFFCATYPSLTITEVKTLWENKIPDLARSFGYTYRVSSDWKYDKAVGDLLVYYLNEDLHIVSFSKNILPDNKVMFTSPAGYRGSKVTANNPDTSITPVSSPVIVSTPIPNTTVPTQTQNILASITVLRYLCSLSENGRARVFGTIKNTSTKVLEYVKINAEFFDGSKFVGQDSTYVQANKLTPNTETTFELFAKTPPYTKCEISFEDSNGKLSVALP